MRLQLFSLAVKLLLRSNEPSAFNDAFSKFLLTTSEIRTIPMSNQEIKGTDTKSMPQSHVYIINSSGLA
jgi:hypothetical protein